MDKQQNYPAAHSMDTYWFAVDLDGNLGFFDTGESGAVPSGVNTEIDGLVQLFSMLPEDNRGVRHFPISDQVLNDNLSLQELLDYIERTKKWAKKQKQKPYFHFMDMAIEFKTKRWQSILPSRPGLVKLHPKREVYYLGIKEPEHLFKLLQLREVKGVLLNFSNSNTLAKVTRCFFYEEKAQLSYGRGISDYERIVAPEKPTKVADLPSELQDPFRFTLPVRFSEQKILQPLEHVKGRALEKYYINKDGEKVDYDFDRDS